MKLSNEEKTSWWRPSVYLFMDKKVEIEARMKERGVRSISEYIRLLISNDINK